MSEQVSGLALRHDSSTIEGWVREADIAMYAAKARGKNRVEQYDARLADAAAGTAQGGSRGRRCSRRTHLGVPAGG